MSIRPYRLGKCIGHAILIWIIGFVWGTIVILNPPQLFPTVPYVSQFPSISVPLLILYVFLIYFLSKRYLAGAVHKRAEAWKYGITLLVINALLDTLVIFVAFKNYDYFSYLSIWMAYALLLFMPVYASRQVDGEVTK